MKAQVLKKTKDLNYSEVKNQQLKVTKDTKMVRAPFIGITEDGSPIYYGKFQEDSTELLKVFEALKFGSTRRHGGNQQVSTYTNYSPRVANKNNFCAASKFSYDYPEYQRVVNEYAEQLNNIYQEKLPEFHSEHLARVGEGGDYETLPNYKIGDLPFTSGIINKNSAIGCHKDSKNMPGALSAMLVLKRSVSGGYLLLPEYDLAFPMENNTILLFDGGKIMHGVTPIKLLGGNSYRYSIVFYTQKDMRNCLPPDEETKRINDLVV